MSEQEGEPTAHERSAGDASLDTVHRRTGGRSARVRSAVLAAAISTLGDTRSSDVKVAEISRRADVHQSSIQRRWGTLDALLLDALLSYSDELIPVPDTGTLHGDLTQLAFFLAEYLATRQGAALTRAMAYIPFIAPTPLLMMPGDNDVLTPAEIALDAFEMGREPKRLHLLPGGHFDALDAG